MLTLSYFEALHWSERESRGIEAALASCQPGDDWRVVHLAPEALEVEGRGDLRRLRLRVVVYLAAGDAVTELRLRLTGDAWKPPHPMPPGCGDLPVEVAQARPDGLAYAPDELAARPAESAGWLGYLASEDEADLPDDAALGERVAMALSHWLVNALAIDTPEGAWVFAMNGPVGYFGPVEPCVLERSNQADLAVDVTRLAEADDRDLMEEGGYFLTLYGERHGLWLLHRRQAVIAKSPRKSVPGSLNCEVLVAESAAALIAIAGMGRVEKRLFHAAGVLPHATLWGASPGTADPTTALDLAGLAERPRRHLQDIAALAWQGKLAAADIDLLFRTARHLARANR